MGLAVAVPVGSAAQDVDLDGVGHVLGSLEAPVTVVELGDFGCWACALWRLRPSKRATATTTGSTGPGGPRGLPTIYT